MIRLVGCAMMFVAFSKFAAAHDSTDKVREGMRLYSAQQYEEASKSFAAATESLEKAKSDKAAIAAYDEACALHRKGDFELARDRYLKAGLSHDKTIATNAHFNIGVIASEQARKLAGETPETIPADKRKEILDELSRAIDSYRHCLELQPQYAPARRNLELLRQWIKYHTDRWREADLQKRRDETNLIQFLEYLVATELSLKNMSDGFRSNTSPNAFAELKRVQDELREEIPYLKEKIDTELRPKENDPNSTAPNANSAEDQKDLERGIELLKGWADEAGDKMAAAGRELMKREAVKAAESQQRASDQLDQIWDAVVPFHPLLANELAEQTQIAKKLSPPETQENKNDKDASVEKPTEPSEPEDSRQKLEVNDKEWKELNTQQVRTLRKTRLLGPKAESELGQFEKFSMADETAHDPGSKDHTPDGNNNASSGGQKIDPEAIKAGYQKAMELAPKAVEEMEAVVKMLGKRDREQAATHAEEARLILKEIQDAQPKNPDQDKNQQQENQENKEKNQEQNRKEDENKDPKDDQKKPDDPKQQEEKKKSEEDKKEKEKQAEQQQQEPKVSKDRIEEALRRVREREQEKRERDRELKARVLGRVPVDKDW